LRRLDSRAYAAVASGEAIEASGAVTTVVTTVVTTDTEGAVVVSIEVDTAVANTITTTRKVVISKEMGHTKEGIINRERMVKDSTKMEDTEAEVVVPQEVSANPYARQGISRVC